jgi:hypothetical protein
MRVRQILLLRLWRAGTCTNQLWRLFRLSRECAGGGGCQGPQRLARAAAEQNCAGSSKERSAIGRTPRAIQTIGI